ncbi:DUF2946 family protein [Hyphomonas adhaerens]|uniref:DUF2946 domain-containing protein n=1 Tax=Hyphomonas adhaerens TaxID=81029 RepID=A0A3B9H354_9PROT|nr:DUF2946 family protein [Hyphomonas adhaerens]HAE29123.1 hypothetical protein [Hyphomonas adhaerens]|tara:strand:- start:583 stop:975 length:393 start_codon:yes stop_codon:yes gene_type:complete
MSLLSAVALMAMIVRGLVPAGYMLAAADTPGDFVSIVICHGDGTDGTQALLDLKNGKIVDPEEIPGQTDDGKNQACPYAMSAHFTPADVSGKLAEPVEAPARFLTQFDYIVPGRGLAAPPPPARGPPLTI